MALARFLLVGALAACAACGSNSDSEVSSNPRREVVKPKPYEVTVGHVQISVSLPRGWRGQGGFLIAPDEHDCACRGLFFHELPYAVYDPDANYGRILPRGSFVEWLVHHPHLRVRGRRAVVVGGVSGEMIDFDVLRIDREAQRNGFCGLTNSAGPCLPITADPDEEGYVSIELWPSDPGEPYTFIVLEVSARRSLLVEVQGFEREKPDFERVLSTVRLRADP